MVNSLSKPQLSLRENRRSVPEALAELLPLGVLGAEDRGVDESRGGILATDANY